jgi:predicted nucleic acid-binding protein
VAVYYLDSSALVKRYMIEQGSTWVRDITDPAKGNRLYIVRLAGPEIIAALFRKARGGQIGLREARRAASNFRSDWTQQYRIIEVTVSLVDRAMDLAERYALRGYDAVHLAAASELHQDRQTMQLPALTFVSADGEQLQAAQAEGLAMENPDSHI